MRSSTRVCTTRPILKARLANPLGSRPAKTAPKPMTRKAMPPATGSEPETTGRSIRPMPPRVAPVTDVMPKTTASSSSGRL